MSDKLQFVVLAAYVDKLKFVGHSDNRFTLKRGGDIRFAHAEAVSRMIFAQAVD